MDRDEQMSQIAEILKTVDVHLDLAERDGAPVQTHLALRLLVAAFKIAMEPSWKMLDTSEKVDR